MFKILTNCSPHILTFSLWFITISALEYIKFLILSYCICFSAMTINLLKYSKYCSSKKILIIQKYWWLIDWTRWPSERFSHYLIGFILTRTITSLINLKMNCIFEKPHTAWHLSTLGRNSILRTVTCYRFRCKHTFNTSAEVIGINLNIFIL